LGSKVASTLATNEETPGASTEPFGPELTAEELAEVSWTGESFIHIIAPLIFIGCFAAVELNP
jgi:hypothetical protein